MIDLTALTALRAVAAHGSVTAASEALRYTPSAVSQQVKRLEQQVGVPLLERVGRGVMLTRHGRHLVDSGARVLAELEQLESGLHRQAGTVAGHLRLAVFSTGMRGLVAPVVRDLRRAHPALEITMSDREPWDAVDLVATGQCDLGIVHRWGDVPIAVPDHLESTLLTQDVADVVVHRDHPLASRSGVTPRDLVDEEWVATPPWTICRQWLERMYDGTGRTPRVVHESMEFQSHVAMVAAELGIALVPRLGREVLPDTVVALPATDPVPTRDVLAVHRRTMAESPALRAVVAALAGRSVDE